MLTQHEIRQTNIFVGLRGLKGMPTAISSNVREGELHWVLWRFTSIRLVKLRTGVSIPHRKPQGVLGECLGRRPSNMPSLS